MPHTTANERVSRYELWGDKIVARIPNVHELTCTDGSGSTGDVLNVDTVNDVVSLPNGSVIKFYSDDYTTFVGQIIGGRSFPPQSATAVVIASGGGAGGTIATANIGISRVAPAGPVTGCILAAGTVQGQQCWVLNESTLLNSVTFAASGTSHVAGGVNDEVPGMSARCYVWDSVTSLWYGATKINDLVQSATAVVIAGGGTIATVGVGESRVNPAGAVTGCILAAGTVPGQQCIVVNEATVEKTVQFDVSGTSYVADGINCIIPGLSAKLFVWDTGVNLWFDSGQTINGTVNLAQSATAVVIAGAGTIATAGVGVSRVNPAGAVTGVILASGVFPGQMCWVVNEAVAANTVTFDVSGTSHVAGGVLDIIPGLQGRLYVWDSGTSLWYATPQIATVTALTQSAGAVALLQAGTIDTTSSVSRISPAAARTACIMQAGTVAGQLCIVVNEAVYANSVKMDVQGTSHVADGGNCFIPGLSSRLFVWDTGTSLWYEHNLEKIYINASQAFTVNDGTNDVFNINSNSSPCHVELINGAILRLYSDTGYTTRTVEISGGTISVLQSTTAPDILDNGTVTITSLGVSRVTPAAARTGIIVPVGTLNGQQLVIINEAAAANSLTMAAVATSHVADGVGTIIAGLTSARFTWNGTSWFRG